MKRRENLERSVREILGGDIEPDELDRLLDRLEALKVALDELAHLVIQTNEPMTMAVLEDE